MKAQLKGETSKVSNRDFDKLKRLFPTLVRIAKKDGFNISSEYGGDSQDFYERCDKYLERHCKVSETDVDVLAAAMAEEAESHKEIVIASGDKDHRQAVDKMGNAHLHYANAYGDVN